MKRNLNLQKIINIKGFFLKDGTDIQTNSENKLILKKTKLKLITKKKNNLSYFILFINDCFIIF